MGEKKNATTEASTTLKKDKQCKSCVRFRSEEPDEKVTTSIYIQNSAFEAMGRPEMIKLTVTPA